MDSVSSVDGDIKMTRVSSVSGDGGQDKQLQRYGSTDDGSSRRHVEGNPFAKVREEGIAVK